MIYLAKQLQMDLDATFDRLWPICRSITGFGLRQSLSILKEVIPFEIISKPSGEKVFDWEVPREWIINSAQLEGPDGKVYCEFKDSNLSIVNYSVPVNRELEFDDLQPHLHSIPDLPDAIPYVTSYYQDNWGFCLPHSLREKLPIDGKYKCFIDSDHIKGSLNYGHFLLEGGFSKKEVLLSSYLCHPSLANNELSGPLVLMGLYERISRWKSRRFNYRFYCGPETIGSLCFLKDFGDVLQENLVLGLVLTCLGGKSNHSLSVKLPRSQSSFASIFLSTQKDFRFRSFTPCGGSDERQFCSPGFDLPVANICRDVYGDYEGYHNSLDNKDSMTIDSLARSIDRIELLLKDFELSHPFYRVNPYGEPQLGKRGLYPNVNSSFTLNNSADSICDGRTLRDSIMWILSCADGQHSLEDVSHVSHIPLDSLRIAACKLMDERLIF